MGHTTLVLWGLTGGHCHEYTIIASILVRNAVGDGVPFEDGEERGSSTDSHVGLLLEN